MDTRNPETNVVVFLSKQQTINKLSKKRKELIAERMAHIMSARALRVEVEQLEERLLDLKASRN